MSAPAVVAGQLYDRSRQLRAGRQRAGVSGTLVAALDPADTSRADDFRRLLPDHEPSPIAGRSLSWDRGICTSYRRPKNVQDAGAIAVVSPTTWSAARPRVGWRRSYHHDPDDAAFTQADGAAFEGSLRVGVMVRILLDPTRLAGTDSTRITCASTRRTRLRGAPRSPTGTRPWSRSCSGALHQLRPLAGRGPDAARPARHRLVPGPRRAHPAVTHSPQAHAAQQYVRPAGQGRGACVR